MRLEQLQKIAQKQILSPRIMLSMKMLPLTTMELSQQISQQLENNPALELVEKEPLQTESGEAVDALQEKLKLFQPFQNSRRRNSSSSNDTNDFLASIPSKTTTLYDHLTEQLHLLNISEELTAVAENIVGNLDWKGYLLAPQEELKAGLPEPFQPLFSEALSTVQGLDPAGIGAGDLQECLLLQLERYYPEAQFAQTVIRDHFQLLTNNQLPKIARKLHCSIETIQEELSKIKKLSFHPGARYSPDSTQFIKPDVTLEKGTYGFRIRVIDEKLPQVQLNDEVIQLLSRKDLTPETKYYIKKKIESAKWIMQALEGRHRTLENITQAIMEFQRGFVQSGPTAVRPLKMQTIAEAVGVHTSTVSRTIKGKYIETPWGTIPLRSFFGGSVKTDQGNTTSKHAFKQRIMDIINREDKSRPYSDGTITFKLKAQGFKISRRTVSKYRNSLNIPNVKLRKVYS